MPPSRALNSETLSIARIEYCELFAQYTLTLTPTAKVHKGRGGSRGGVKDRQSTNTLKHKWQMHFDQLFLLHQK